MVKIMSLLAKAESGLGFSFEVRAWTEMQIQHYAHPYHFISMQKQDKFNCRKLMWEANEKLKN